MGISYFITWTMLGVPYSALFRMNYLRCDGNSKIETTFEDLNLIYIFYAKASDLEGFENSPFQKLKLRLHQINTFKSMSRQPT